METGNEVKKTLKSAGKMVKEIAVDVKDAAPPTTISSIFSNPTIPILLAALGVLLIVIILLIIMFRKKRPERFCTIIMKKMKKMMTGMMICK